MTEVFSFGDSIDLHEKGNVECPACWSGYPKWKCRCGGLVHAEFGDENYDGDYWLYHKCDKCGDGFDEKEGKDK